MDRAFVTPGQLTDLVGAHVGSDRRLTGLARLAGGSRKGVYRLTLDDGQTVVLYVWADDENYWPATTQDPLDPFTDASGPDLFTAAHRQLEALGIRTPELLLLDRGRRHLPADLALVEDVPGGTLEALLARDPAAAAGPLDQLGTALASMAGRSSPCLGRVALVDDGQAPPALRAERLVLDRALRHLAAAADRVGRLDAARDQVTRRLHELAAAIMPREAYGLVHGELGPDHVLLDDDRRPVLIDIEGLMFFDVEWEHAFTEMRFGPYSGPLRPPGLDPARLRFYRLAQSLSLVEGPLRLADGDFPHRDLMLGIARHHTSLVLAAVGLVGTGRESTTRTG